MRNARKNSLTTNGGLFSRFEFNIHVVVVVVVMVVVVVVVAVVVVTYCCNFSRVTKIICGLGQNLFYIRCPENHCILVASGNGFVM